VIRLQPLLFAALVAAAAVLPLSAREGKSATAAAVFPGWPAEYEGRAIKALLPAPDDAWLARAFPGRIARFSDGERQIVLRWVAGPTRLLHPAAQCFRAAGYNISTAPMRGASDGAAMACFRASKDGKELLACERVFDGRGNSWPDVSAWYWHAVLNRASSGYWAVLEVGADRG
jgi:hypothetical protein